MQPIQYPLAHLPMLGKGSVLFDRFDANGNLQGLMHLGNCTKFDIDLKDTRAELYQSLNKSVTLIAAALKQRQPMIHITGTDFNFDHVGLATMSAGASVLSVAVGNITNETLISASAITAGAYKGRYYQTANKNIDPTPANVVVKQGASTLVAGTDYIVVDPVQGLIYIPVGTSITTVGGAVTINYGKLVGTFNQVAGATQGLIQGRLVFSPDPTDGAKIGAEIWRVNLSPNGALGMIADDYGNWTLDGYILDDTANHPAAPFFLLTQY
jgi:hypothetical protein